MTQYNIEDEQAFCATHKREYVGSCPDCALEEPSKIKWCDTHSCYYWNSCLLCDRGIPGIPVQGQHIGAAIAKETPLISAHALAAAELLQQVVDRLHGGVPPEDLGFDVQRIGTMMRREL